MFCRDMGLWKTSTDATMTMTRFRQLPMECVTGDTRWRIMYDTCAMGLPAHTTATGS